MKKLPAFITIILAVIHFSLIGRITKADYYNKIDNAMFLLSKNKNITFDSIVTVVKQSYLKNECRVRAYYTWIALNIHYDTEHLKAMSEFGFNLLKKDSSQEASIAFIKRKAVCEGFSKLMNAFCAATSIPSQMVIGYSKMPDGEVVSNILHAWNAVKIDSSWQLVDITWSNGFVGAYGIYNKKFSDKYFIGNTNNFYIDHLSLDPQWQITTQPISKNYFFRTDTLEKYFSTAFNYNDSINFYKKQSRHKQEWLDYVHYHQYDTQNSNYLNYADYIIINKSIDDFNEATLDLQEYQIFYNQTLSKVKTATNFKKAKKMLESTKNKYQNVLNYLADKKAFSPKLDESFRIIRRNSNIKLANVNQLLDYNVRLQKLALHTKNKS